MKQYLAQGCDVNCVSDFFAPAQNAYLHDATALIIATNDHCNEAMQLLLQNGCDVHMTNSNGDNALLRFGCDWVFTVARAGAATSKRWAF